MFLFTKSTNGQLDEVGQSLSTGIRNSEQVHKKKNIILW